MLRPPLHYNLHRTYDPMVGRYLEPDPLGQLSDINVYRYAASNPANRVDTDGRDLEFGSADAAKALIGSLIDLMVTPQGGANVKGMELLDLLMKSKRKTILDLCSGLPHTETLIDKNTGQVIDPISLADASLIPVRRHIGPLRAS